MRIFRTPLALAVAALLASGCGGSDLSEDEGDRTTTRETSTSQVATGDDASNDGDAQVLELGVVPGELEFDKTEMTATAGTITLRLSNEDAIAHNVAIEDEEGPIVAKGISEITVDLEPGTYEYVCTPHDAAGMTGTLTVTS